MKLFNFTNPFKRKSVTINLGDQFIRAPGALSDSSLRQAGVRVTNSIVESCLAFYTDCLPEARLAVYDASKELMPAHPVYALIRKSNPLFRYNWNDVMGSLGVDLALDGNSYLITRLGGYSQASHFDYATGMEMRPVEKSGSGTGLKHYEYRKPDGTTEKIEPEFVTHFRVGIDPNNKLLGINRFKSVALSVLTDNEAERYNFTILANKGVMGFIISPANPEDQWDQKQAAEMADRVARQFSGENRGRPFFPTKAVKIETIGETPDKMQVREMRMTPEERICSVLRVPPMVAGLGAGIGQSAYANGIRDARKQATEQALVPMWRLIADALTSSLQLPGLLKDGQYIDFDFSTVQSMQEDQTARVERGATAFAKGIWTRADARRHTGQEVKPEDEVYIEETQRAASEAAIVASEASKARQRSQLAESLDDASAK